MQRTTSRPWVAMSLLAVVLVFVVAGADARSVTSETQGTQTCASDVDCSNEQASAVVTKLVEDGFRVRKTGVVESVSEHRASFAFAVLTRADSHLVVWLRNQANGDQWKTAASVVGDFATGENRIPYATFGDYVSIFVECLGGEAMELAVDVTPHATPTLSFRVPVRVQKKAWIMTFTFPLEACGPTTPPQKASPTLLRVPEDVHWFFPDEEGWLCDYMYVRAPSGALQLRLIPRGEGLGKILVYDKDVVKNAFMHRRPPFTGTFHPFFACGEFESDAIVAASAHKKLIIAMNQWGGIECIFVTAATFGASKSYTGVPTELPLYENITLTKRPEGVKGVATQRFPGLEGTDETMHVIIS